MCGEPESEEAGRPPTGRAPPPLPYLPPSLLHTHTPPPPPPPPSLPPFLGRGGIPGCPWDICLPEEGTSLTDTLILAACATSIFSKREKLRRKDRLSLSLSLLVSEVTECRCFEGGRTCVSLSDSQLQTHCAFFSLSLLVLPRGAPLFSVSLPAAVSV